MEGMKKLHVPMYITSVGDTHLWVPENMTLEEAIKYAKEHISEIPTPFNLELCDGMESLDEDNCDFED